MANSVNVLDEELKSEEMRALNNLYLAFLNLNNNKGFEKEYALLSAFIFNHSPHLNENGKVICRVKK